MKRTNHKLLDVEVIGSEYITTYKKKPFSGFAEETLTDGKLEESCFVEGRQTGPCLLWTKDHVLIQETWHLANKKHGISWTWSPEGKLIKEEVYDHGYLLKKTEWDQHGNQTSYFEADIHSPDYEGLLQIRKLRRNHNQQ